MPKFKKNIIVEWTTFFNVLNFKNVVFILKKADV